MNLTDRQYLIIKLLKENRTAMSSVYLCDELGISSRTLRYEISDINRSAGCKLIRSNKEGYRLDGELDLENIFKSIQLDEYLDLTKEVILLLLEKEEIQACDIEDACFISQPAVNNILKQVLEPMDKSGLRLEKSGQVYRTIGSEFDKRRFLMQLLFSKDCDLSELQMKKNSYFNSLPFAEVNTIVNQILADMEIGLDDVYLKHVVISTAISLQRYKNGHRVTEKYEDASINEDNMAYRFDKELMSRIRQKLGICVPEEEFRSIFRFHMGAFRGESYLQVQEHLILNNPMFETLIRKIVEDTFRHFNIKADYHEFFQGLALHIYYLLLRAKSSTFVKVDMTDNLKHTNPFVYEVSVYMAYLIEGEFNTSIPDEEIGLFAIYIGAVILEDDDFNMKSRVILACPNYNNLREKLTRQIQGMFHKQIEIIKCVSDYSHIKDMDEYDFIISLLGNQLTLRDVVIVSPIIGAREFHRIDVMAASCSYKRKRNELKQLLLKYLSKDLFFYNQDKVEGMEILKFLCGHMREKGIVKDTFLKLVLKREEMASTAFFNKFAIPHSINADANETKIAFYYRDEPVKWFGKEINLILLLATKGYDKEFVRLYEMLFEMLMSKELCFKLLHCQTYEELVDFIINHFDV